MPTAHTRPVSAPTLPSIDRSATDAQRPSGSERRPGLTSLVRTGRGIMTLQTEVLGDPAELVTIVDHRGRVLKSWRKQLEPGLGEDAVLNLARGWHGEVEQRVRKSLAQAARRQSGDETVTYLFIAAARAHAERDFSSARSLLEVCDLLRPGDARVCAALAHLRRRAERPLSGEALRPVPRRASA